jgi:hypothetical protein
MTARAALILFLGAVTAVAIAKNPAQQRTPIERAADLPRHT